MMYLELLHNNGHWTCVLRFRKKITVADVSMLVPNMSVHSAQYAALIQIV